MANIRTARRSGLVLRGGRNRRESLWVSGPVIITTITTASTAVLTATLGAIPLNLRPFTVVRTRGYLHVSGDQLTGTENWGVSMGMAVVSDQAAAIGVTAVPTPETDRDSDLWFVYETIMGRFGLSSAIGLLELGEKKDYDSRAMRKVEGGQDIAVVLETSASHPSAIVAHAFRQLIKLH